MSDWFVRCRQNHNVMWFACFDLLPTAAGLKWVTALFLLETQRASVKTSMAKQITLSSEIQTIRNWQQHTSERSMVFTDAYHNDWFTSVFIFHNVQYDFSSKADLFSFYSIQFTLLEIHLIHLGWLVQYVGKYIMLCVSVTGLMFILCVYIQCFYISAFQWWCGSKHHMVQGLHLYSWVYVCVWVCVVLCL